MSYEDLARVLQGTQEGLTGLAAAAIATPRGPHAATPGSSDDSVPWAEAPTVHDGTSNTGNTLVGIPAPGPGPTTGQPVAPGLAPSTAAKTDGSNRIAKWWKGLPNGTRLGIIIVVAVLGFIFVVTVAGTLACYYYGHRDDSLQEVGMQADAGGTRTTNQSGEKTADTASQDVSKVVGSRSRATAGKAQDSPTGQAKHPNKDTKGSAKSAQAKDYTAAKQSDGFWQRVKRGATDALHHLPRTQAGSAKGAEGLKSALTSLQRFEESMAPDLTTIIQDVVNGFTKILSDSKCGSDKMAIALVGARDASAELLQATRSAADEQWKLLEKAYRRAPADARTSWRWAHAQTVRGRIERRIVKAEEQLKIRFDRAVAAVQKSWARGG
ncbi:g1024 [Coccomyxa viridis]|uniref:G1024 protein n=1 Tax=Coccomyxa viridis TaxID=1274662 RepID=A0ABP1FH26_9CHLO